MKNNIKKALTLMLAVVFAVSAVYMPAFAEDELTNIITSTLENNDDIYSATGFEIVSWASARCGYTTARNIYTNNTGTAEIVFDAGAGNLFKKAEFKVTIHQNDAWMINESAHLANVVKVSTDGTAFTSVTPTSCVEGDVTYDGSTPHKNFTITVDVADGARYLKICCFSINTYRMFVHNAVLDGTLGTTDGGNDGNDENDDTEETQTPIVNSDLVSDTPYSTELSEGIYVASWNGIGNEFGDSTRSNFLSNNTASPWLVFDAGEENYYNAAEFKIGVHSFCNWVINDMGAGNDQRIYYSNDAENWTGAYATCEVVQASSPKLAVLKAEGIPNSRYIKIGINGLNPAGNSLYFHYAKLWGVVTREPEPELPPEQTEAEIVHRDPCLTTILPQNDYITATYNDFQSQNWEVKWFDDGRATMILSNNAGDDVPDTITYAVKDTRHDIVSLYWRMIEQQLGISYCETPKITYSKDGIIWSEPVLAQKVSEASIPYTDAWHSRMVEYSVQVPAEGMKYVKLDTTKNGCRFAWIDVGLNTSTNALDMVSLADNTTVKADGEAWRATGTINCATEEISAATVILALFSGNKMVGVKPVILPLENGAVDFNITANAGDATVTTAELYLWTSQLEMVPLAVNPIVVTAN